jgi:hypothetical protein
MTSWLEAMNYGKEWEDDGPPPCPGCVDLQRRLDNEHEFLSEVVLGVPQADGSPALMRCSPNLPQVVRDLVEACQVANRYIAEFAMRGGRGKPGVEGLDEFCEVQQRLSQAIRDAGAKHLPTRED